VQHVKHKISYPNTSTNITNKSAGPCDISADSVNLPQETKNYLFSISFLDIIGLLDYRLYLNDSGSWSNLYYLDHLKISDWLTD